MTTEVATQNRQELTQSSPVDGLRLLGTRECFRWDRDPDTNAMRRVYVVPSPEEAKALEEARVWLESRLVPGTKQTIIGALARLANHSKSERSAAEWKMLFEDYCQDLGEFSDAHVQQAVVDHRRSSNWFPKIAELRERCSELRGLDAARLRRCEQQFGKL